MLAELFLSVADAVISYAVDKLDPAEKVKSWLRRDPVTLAFQKSLARTYSAFARQYPDYANSLFDQIFLTSKAVPELSKLLARNQHPDPALLAQAWGESIGANTEFSRSAIKPASDFLLWLEEELKGEPALQPLFDSRALDNIEAGIENLTQEIQRGFDAALKSANNYQQAAIHVGGDVKGDGIIIGHKNSLTINKYNYSTNYFYSGDFISLNEYYIPPDGVFQRVDVDKFVGRDWLTAKVDAFLNDPNRKSGAFLLIGDAGVGKTSFMAHLVKERRYLHLFAEQAPGQAMLQRAMQSLGSQLVTRYQIDPYKDRDTLNALSVFPDFLERILRLAASTLTNGEKIVIVCDALDEAGVFPDHYVFGLPKELPDGVYFILSQRPVNVKLPNFEPVIERLEAQGEDNLQDIQAYLSAVAKRPEVLGQIRSKEYSEEFFIQTLKEKSQGVWMYLHYIIKEIESGARAPLDLANLPTGLVGYYAEYWDAWRTGKRGKGEEAWDELYAPLLTTLAAAQEAIPVDWLIKWADVTVTPREVTRLLTEHWRAFITEKETDGKKAYTPYHLSFKDFITGRVDTTKLPPAQANLVKDLAAQTVDAHKRIVNAFEKECNGEWEKLVEQDYPRLHLSAHLNGAGEYETLRILLTEGDEKIKWAEAKERKEEIYAGYLNDLTYVQNSAEREQNFALAIRCMLIENSIHSLAENIPPKLLAELAKAGLWSYARCISTIRQKSDSQGQAESIILVIPDVPASLIQETLNTAFEIRSAYDRVRALIALIPYLKEDAKIILIQEVLANARKINPQTNRAHCLFAVTPFLEGDTKAEALREAFSIADKIKSDFDRATILSIGAPYLDNTWRERFLDNASKMKMVFAKLKILSSLRLLNAGDNSKSINKALKKLISKPNSTKIEILVPHLDRGSIARVFSALQTVNISEINQASALSALFPYLSDDLKAKAYSVIQNLQDSSARAYGLSGISPYMNAEARTQTLIDALNAARVIKDELARIYVLCSFEKHLKDEIRIPALKAALDTVETIKDTVPLASVMSALAPSLNAELVNYALTVVRKIKNETDRANAFIALTPHLNTVLIPAVLDEAKRISDKILCVRVLSCIAGSLTGEEKSLVCKDALAIVKTIEDKMVYVEAVSSVAPNLPENLRTQILMEALSAVQKIGNEVKQARALTTLASCLYGESMEQALIMMKELKFHHFRVLTSLAPKVGDKLRPQVLDFIEKIANIRTRARFYSLFAAYISDQQKAEAISAVIKIRNPYRRISELSELAPHLSSFHKNLLFNTVNSIENQRDRIHIMSVLARHFDKDQVDFCYSEINKVYEEPLRSRSLLFISPVFNTEKKIEIFQEVLFTSKKPEKVLGQWALINYFGLDNKITSFIRSSSAKKRSEGLQTIKVFSSALVHQSGEEIVPELYRAIQDTARWWP